MEPDRFIAEHTKKLEPVLKKSGLAWWDLSTTGSEEAAARSKEIREQILRIYADPDDYRRVKAWDEEQAATDPQAARIIRLLHLDYAGSQKDDETIRREAALTTELQQIFTNFRPLLRGEEAAQSDIEAVLQDSTDGDLRQEAWEASQAVGRRVEEGILELVALRNQVARDLGYRDHYALALETTEIDETDLLRVLDDLEGTTAEPFAAAKAELDAELAERFGRAPAELMPWHYVDPFFQQAPPSGGVDLDPYFVEQDIEALTVATYDGLGLEIRSLLAMSDLYPREGKNQHAFCINLDREGDIRVLANIRPSERWMSTMLHEFGHAVYDGYISPDLPFLLRRPAHALMTEGVAMFMQRLTQDATWLAAVAGVPEEEARELADRLQKRARLESLIMTRWMLVMCRFERALYGDADLDRNALWWELKERLQLLRRPEGRDGPDWAAKVHLAVAPVYYQNYLLGDMVASKLDSHLRSVSADGEITGSRAVGRTLVDRLFRPGRLRPWREALDHFSDHVDHVSGTT